MQQLKTAAMAIVLVATMIGTAPLASASETNQTEDRDIAPGEQLAGIVGVQEAELDGELDERTFGVRIANAASDDARADVVAEQLGDVEGRLSDLDQREAAIEERRADGEMTEGQYAAEMARIAAETRTAERLVNASEEEASDLPAELLEERGVNAEAIATLQDRANELGGPEVATIARSIAGDIDRAGQDERDGQDDRDGQNEREERDDRDQRAEQDDRNGQDGQDDRDDRTNGSDQDDDRTNGSDQDDDRDERDNGSDQDDRGSN